MSEPTVVLSLMIDGASRSEEIDPRSLLVEALRDAFDVLSPKIGCATGDCGACTIELDGRIVKSCLTLALAAEGARVATIEGLADDGGLSTLQQAFWDEYAFQCGFCLSGMLFASRDLLARTPDPSDDEIRNAIAGNLCRCTGYENIVTAVRSAAASARA